MVVPCTETRSARKAGMYRKIKHVKDMCAKNYIILMKEMKNILINEKML
jgi:hypothetical protein